MDIQIDDKVKSVAEFMQRNVPANQLVSVASAVAALAPILWGRYAPSQKVDALLLTESAISQPAASESLLEEQNAGGGSVQEVDAAELT